LAIPFFLLPVVYALLEYIERAWLSVSSCWPVSWSSFAWPPPHGAKQRRRQWEARYFLPIIPITLVVLAVVAQQWQPLVKRKVDYAFIAAFLNHH